MENITKILLFSLIFLAIFMFALPAGAALPPLQVSCYASPNPGQINQLILFNSSVFGGSGNYTYSWSGACTSNSQSCSGNFVNSGTYTASVYANSIGPYGAQSGTANCSVVINSSCISHNFTQCYNNAIYYYDSCGNQQDLIQYCPQGCYSSSCSNYNYSYPSCNYHAYRLCLGNSIYWYDSCDNQQDLYQTCYGTNQICQYGQCVYNPPAPSPYIAYYRTACYGNSIYWYDSLGVVSGLYKNCADENTCTADSCGAGKCSNVVKCDGSTCAVGSADYNTYCATSQNTSLFSIAFFVKEEATSTNWKKSAEAGQNDEVYFMLSVVNNSSIQLDNVNVSANIPAEVALLGNLQVNGAVAPGDIVAGINIGSLSPATAKTITFDGKTQTLSVQATKQATAAANVSGTTQTDSIEVILNPGQVAGAAISSATTGFWAFLKRWYLWILVGLVLIFLFIIVFRRLSSTNNA